MAQADQPGPEVGSHLALCCIHRMNQVKHTALGIHKVTYKQVSKYKGLIACIQKQRWLSTQEPQHLNQLI